MWKSRIDKLPPAQYFADLIQHLRNLYPGAIIDEALVRTMREIWIAEWRAGQSAQDTAKATCSCDGKAIVPSAGAGRELGKRLARPPKGAKRGDVIAPESLREVTPLAMARREAEKYAQAFDRVRAAAMKLLQAKAWTASKGLRLQKLQSVLRDLKGKHDAAVKKYEEVRRSRREGAQPALYEKPLGAVGLSLRPDELPTPPPPKEKKAKRGKAPQEPKLPKPPKPPKAPKVPKAAKGKPAGTKDESTASSKAATDPDCNCKKGTPAPTLPSAPAPAAQPRVEATPKPARTASAEITPSTAPDVTAPAKPKRGRPPKAAAAPKAPAAPEKPALSDAEAEELANLFAAADAEDKKR